MRFTRKQMHASNIGNQGANKSAAKECNTPQTFSML